MRTTLIASLLLLLCQIATEAQDSKAALETVAKALGADVVKSIQYDGSGAVYAFGQSGQPGRAWPRFHAKSFTRSINYDMASMRDQIVRTQAENTPRGGGNQPIRGEARQTFVLNGDQAWNIVGENPVPAPIAVFERQFQLWATPHGIVKAALAGKGSMSGRTISLAVGPAASRRTRSSTNRT